MIEIACQQLSPEWWEARRGIPTASDFGKIMTPTKRQASASQEPYIAQLISDITCLSPNYFTQQGGPVNASVAYGRATEDEARRYYEHKTERKVTQVGFILTDDRRFGCSPDGLVNPEGDLELKCPDRKTHMLYLMKKQLPVEYRCQVHGHLIVTGRQWCDFMSYCVGCEPLIIRVVQDDFTMALRMHLELFWEKFEAVKKELRIGQPSAPEPPNQQTVDLCGAWRDQLKELAGQVQAGEADEQDIMDRVNSWIREKEITEAPPQTKLAVYGVLKAWINSRPVPWYLDTVNMLYRLEETVKF